MPPATVRSRPPRAPLTGMLWFGARLSLALRRTRRFRRWWLSVGGTVTVIALLLPVATRTPDSALAETASRAVADSVRSAVRLQRAVQRAAVADSLVTAAESVLAAASVPRAAPPRRAPSAASLAAAIARAQDGRAREAVLALAAHPALVAGPRMRATADSLRNARDPGDAYRLSGTILAMAEYRLRSLSPDDEPSVAPPSVTVTAGVDTAAAHAILRAERDTLDAARRQHEAARAAAIEATQAADAARSTVPLVSPGLAMLVLVLLGLVVRVAVTLMRELREPTLAHPLEAERAVGAPALSWVRDALPEGPLRFRPTGVDPFRVLYLHLTSTGTRARAVIVTGDDAPVVAAVAARLAIAAAADHRTTLVAEWDTEQVALARIFRDHPEPGVSDAMAGAFAWREVARNVGSSDGLSIAMLPAGTTQAPVTDEQRAAALAEFQQFRAAFEFSIVAVSLADLAHGRALAPDAPVVLAASIGVTPVDALQRSAELVERASAPLHSLVLWDAPRPPLPSRAELAAWLSKRKGRTPGGSFKAVQEAIRKPVEGQ
ncbi:hypothetical protein Strain138_000050 [Pseudogemmatithrix spongiicola]|uniref:Uncharacterized protein n=1 Tax=Pseudogemmatithrix spongiicola TaxID=3062599 RepID=A0AA49JXQ3_9BACT|nr:hypothetical protein Strain138_000050 [Gemmatimonadaceae bacterium 'strain 138']WKW13727.1 hypothetical protein Strain318_000050 [Gemmatimonadaceae bacterium 'strain 318']